LACVTGTAFRIENIRGRRAKPGLLRQHLTAVRAAATIADARVEGAALGATAVAFAPRAVRGGRFAFDVGSAGSATLVLQTVLPALLGAPEPSTVTVTGGTHNRQAPSFDFLDRCFRPTVARLAPGALDLALVRPGFFPAGGGVLEARIAPTAVNAGEWLAAAEVTARSAAARVAGVPTPVAVRELATLATELGWPRPPMRIEKLDAEVGPGNVVVVDVARADGHTEVFTGFGERGVAAERVATELAAEVRRYLAADVPIGEHLADQLVLLLALGPGGAFRTLAPSDHLRAHVGVIRRFVPCQIALREEGADRCRVEVRR
jgi:RNA 3'-terminal phosphate cyclase (ATP)